MLLEINLRDRAISYPLCINKSITLKSAAQKVIWDFEIFSQNAFQLISHVLIVRLIFVRQALNVVENIFDFLNIFGDYPKFFLRIVQTFSFDVFDFIHRVFLLFSPLQLLIQEVENHKIQTPQIVSPREVLSLVRA